MDFSTLFRILDIYALQLPTKGGFTWAKWNYVFITSNNAPQNWYKPETMEKIDQTAFWRRIHKIIRAEKMYDPETGDDYINFQLEQDDEGIVPVDKPPVMDKIRFTGSTGEPTELRPFFNPEKFKANRAEKLQRLSTLKTVEQVEEEFRVPVTPDDSGETGNQNVDEIPQEGNNSEDPRIETIMECYDVDYEKAKSYCEYLDEEYPGLRTQQDDVQEEFEEEDNDIPLQPETTELEEEDDEPLERYDWREAEGRYSSAESDNDIPVDPDNISEEDNDDTPGDYDLNNSMDPESSDLGFDDY